MSLLIWVLLNHFSYVLIFGYYLSVQRIQFVFKWLKFRQQLFIVVLQSVFCRTIFLVYRLQNLRLVSVLPDPQLLVFIINSWVESELNTAFPYNASWSFVLRSCDNIFLCTFYPHNILLKVRRRLVIRAFFNIARPEYFVKPRLSIADCVDLIQNPCIFNLKALHL